LAVDEHARNIEVRGRRIEQVAVAFVAAALLAGLGTLGWLVGHMGAYDLLARLFGATTTGASPHHYLSIVEHAGLIVTMSGVVLAALLLTAASPSLAARLRTALDSRTATTAALILPTVAFIVIEHAEGSVAQHGLLLLLVGMPLQGALGLLVVRAVQLLLHALADVVEQLVLACSPLLPRAACGASVVVLPVPVLARCPMSTCAPRRGPPLLAP
jgi:hypothetical protein